MWKDATQEWTSAGINMTHGRWSEAARQFRTASDIYRRIVAKNPNRCAHIMPLIEECEKYRDRCQTWIANSEKARAVAVERKKSRPEPVQLSAPAPRIPDRVVDNIMVAFDDLGEACEHTNTMVQSTCTPPPLDESFYMIPRPSKKYNRPPVPMIPRPSKKYNRPPVPRAPVPRAPVPRAPDADDEIRRLQQKIDDKNRLLHELCEKHNRAFLNVKRAMENLSKNHVHLFPEKLKSRYAVLLSIERKMTEQR